MRNPLDNPKIMKRLAVACLVLSIVEWFFAAIFGWVYLVAYVSHLSQLTFSISLIPWIQGLRVEARQVEEDIPNEVAERVIQRSNLKPAKDEAPSEDGAST